MLNCFCNHSYDDHRWPITNRYAECLKCNCRGYDALDTIRNDAWDRSKWAPELSEQIYKGGFTDGFKACLKAVQRHRRDG